MEGHWRAEHLFALQQAVEQHDFIQQQVRVCDGQIEGCLQAFVPHVEGESLPSVPVRKRRSRQKTSPDFEVHAYLYAMTGVDLTQIDGIDSLTALKIISEIGLEMTRWPTGKHFASWLGYVRATTAPVANATRYGANRQPTGRRRLFGWRPRP